MSTLQVSRLESLILDKICSLACVTRAGYYDDGQEVVVLVFHDDVPGKFNVMFDAIVDGGLEIEDEMRGGIEIEDEMRDRMITAIPIEDGPDAPYCLLAGHKTIYVRKAGQ